jgi:hypothetical protein
MNKKTSGSAGLAITGMVLGIIAIVLSGIPIVNNAAFVLGALALIFGIVGVVKAKQSNVGRGQAITAIVLGTVSVCIVLATQAFYSSVMNQASNELNDAMTELEKESDKITGDATEDLLANDVSVELGTFMATTDEYGLTTTELPVTVTNKNAENKSYSIQIEAVNESGARIVDDTVYANSLGSGQSQAFKAFQYVASENVEAMKTATFKIVSVSQI